MPVSSPSYFPPNRGNGTVVGITAGVSTIGARNFLAMQAAGDDSTINDLLIIGHQAGDAGLTDADLAGSVFLGSSVASALIQSITGDANSDKPTVAVGINALAASVNAGANVLVGSGALASFVGNDAAANAVAANVMIGTDVAFNVNGVPGNELPPKDNVLIGYRAAYSTGGVRSSLTRSIIIGSQACEQTGDSISSGSGSTDNVVIGYRAGRVLGQGTNTGINNVILGASSCTSGVGIRESVVIGSGSGVGSGTTRGLTIIGNGASASGTDSTVIGAATVANQGDRNILVGAGAQTNVTAPFSDFIILGTNTHRALYGDMLRGNLLLGDSIAGGAVLSFGTGTPTNLLKLLNGTPASSAPSGGGYFYVDAGASSALHWVNSAGTDVNLSGGGSFGGFANPTATLGLTAVNGAATTAMRSDAAPALSQDIAPTWTGQHTFTHTYAANSPQILCSAATPIISLNETGAAANTRLWELFAGGGVLSLGAANDADSTFRAGISITRSVAAVSEVALGNATDNPVIRMLGTGNVRFDGTATGAQTATFVATNKPGSGTAGPIAWIPVLTAGGTQGYIPIFGA